MNYFREELNIGEVGFIVGLLGEFLGKGGFGESGVEYGEMNEGVKGVRELRRNCY